MQLQLCVIYFVNYFHLECLPRSLAPDTRIASSTLCPTIWSK